MDAVTGGITLSGSHGLIGRRGRAFASTIGLVVGLALAWAPQADAAGGSWSQQSVPAPSGGDWIHLQGVSCNSPSACTIVGFYDNSLSKQVPLAEFWNGSDLTVQNVPAPSVQWSWLEDVSCGSPSACVAIGSFNVSSEEVPLGESWNGTSWSIQSAPKPSGSKRSWLESVSCSSASACITVGGYLPNSAEEVPLGEFWNGSSWSVQSVPKPSGAQLSWLERISCGSASACVALGRAKGRGQEPLGESWNGSSWSVQNIPYAPSGGWWSDPEDVSCSSPSACIAVGEYETIGGKKVPLGESWNGSDWTIQSVPAPSDAKRSWLEGVSCSSVSACVAVGGYENSPEEEVPLAEAWDGSSWSVQSVPAPSGARASWLESVSCGSASACIAVGRYENSSEEGVPLVETWDGSPSAVSNTVELPKAPEPEPSSPASHSRGIAMPTRAAAVLRGYAVVRLSCFGEEACRTPVALIDRIVIQHVARRHGKRRIVRRTKRVVIGKSWARIPAGRRGVVYIRLSRKGMALLRHARRHRLQVMVVGKHVKNRAIVLELRSRLRQRTRRHASQ